MNTRRSTYASLIEHILPWIVLAVLLTYTYSKFFLHSYGFRWVGSDPTIQYIFVDQDQSDLRIGDQLVQIGSVRWDDFQADSYKRFFEGARPGDIIPITVKRDSHLLTIPWNYPGFNRNEFYDQFFSEWFLAYFFWLAGILSLLLLRPRDERWLVLSGFNFLTAIWLIAGSGNSTYHILLSLLVLRSAIWLCVPVYLHLHWIFPHPLRRLPAWSLRFLYAAAVVMAVAEWFQLIPQELYLFGFLSAVSGSLVLIIAHYVRQPEVRSELRIMFTIAVLAILPSILWSILPAHVPPGLALLSLPLLPFSYLYAAYRRQLSGLEIRVNRFVVLYLFVILLGTVLVPLIAVAAQVWKTADSAIFIAIGASLGTTAACLLGYPLFQNFVETRWLGIRLPAKYLQEIYSSRITTSTSISSLLELLRDEVFPSLFIRQYVFLQLDNGTSKVLLASGVTEDMTPLKESDPQLRRFNGESSRGTPLDKNQLYPWARLILPLSIGEDLIGLWFLGRRDPDDSYAQVEVPILQSLANQTAIALSNILQTERLRTMYQANIDRYEQERLHLALDLHDSVLNQLAAMIMELEEEALSSGFQKAYDALAQRLREIVFDLRPPMLNYGLKPAFEELADHLMDRSKDTVTVIVDVESDGQRFPANMEQHIFRIVQEACENAMRHGRAGKITVSGKLSAQECNLIIEDDGIGFDLPGGGKLDEMLASKHYGLLGMIERARLIGAEISFDSSLKTGTRIHIKCTHSPEEDEGKSS